MTDNYLKKELYKKLKDDDEIFNFLESAALDGVWYWDLNDFENEWLSPNFWKTFGYNPDDKKHLASEWKSMIYPQDLKLVEKNFKKHLENRNHPFDQIVRYKHQRGYTVWVRCRGMAIKDENGKPYRMLGVHINITDLMQVHNESKRLQNEYEKVFNGTQDAMFLVEVRGPKYFRFVRNNKSHQTKTHISQEMIEGKTVYEMLGKENADAVVEHYQECVDKQAVIAYEEVLDFPSGKKTWQTTLTPIFTNNKVTHLVGSAVDMTEQKRLEQELKRRANYDDLTKLANRSALTRKLDKCTEDTSKTFTFLFIDLDKFKVINDDYGHAAGDHVLKVIADRLLKHNGKEDFVSRLGGDEFVVLKCDLYDEDDISAYKDSMLKVLNEPIYFEENCFIISGSIGHAKFPLDGLSYDQLSRCADRSMYKMKKNH